MVQPRFLRFNPVLPPARACRTTQQGITVKVNRTNMVGTNNNNRISSNNNISNSTGSRININRIDLGETIRMMKGEFLYYLCVEGFEIELVGAAGLEDESL
jgi:hypothetical protein